LLFAGDAVSRSARQSIARCHEEKALDRRKECLSRIATITFALDVFDDASFRLRHDDLHVCSGTPTEIAQSLSEWADAIIFDHHLNRPTATIDHAPEGKDFAFLKDSVTGEKLFFHRSQSRSGWPLPIGTEVTYHKEKHPKGTRARDVVTVKDALLMNSKGEND